MSTSNHVQNSFLGGEWSPTAQGRFDTPGYKSGLNVNRNALPTSEGAWTRRSGTRHCGYTYRGRQGRLISFDFENSTPYNIELTNALMRMWSVSTQSSGLSSALPATMRLVTTNDNQSVSNISTANPAVITSETPHGWVTGDEVEFLFNQTSKMTPLLRNRTFIITVINSTTFSIVDSLSNSSVDGSTLRWTGAESIVVARVLAITTDYSAADLDDIRSVQAERDSILLHNNYSPKVLTANSVPSSTEFATFGLSEANFKDGPYLDAPTDGSLLLPTQTSATEGALPSTANWSGIASDGAGNLVTVAYNSNKAAYSSDHGATWTSATLPATENWTAVKYGGGTWVAIASGPTTAAAYSTDNGHTWTACVMPASGDWTAITHNGTVFCAVALPKFQNYIYLANTVTVGDVGTNYIATSSDGITWTLQTAPSIPNYLFPGIYQEVLGWSAITSYGATIVVTSYVRKFLINGTDYGDKSGNIFILSTDNGVTWTQITVPTSEIWSGISNDGTNIVAISTGSSSIVTSLDGITWVQRSLPKSEAWSAIDNGGGIFCAVTDSSVVSATSPDGITWTEQSMPYSYNWASIAWDGTYFCTPAYGTAISISSPDGVFLKTTLAATSVVSINDGSGFLSTDVGRHIRLLSEPLEYVSTTAYVKDDTVKFNGVYYRCIAASTGNQPDVSTTYWQISTAAATWTWAIIVAIIEFDDIQVALQGPNLLNTNQINSWRLGAFSDTTGYPTCGCYHEGRLVLGGAIANRFDTSKSNDIYNFAPTAYDGTVADDNAINYTFNSKEVNPIYWMLSSVTGIIAGTQEGEWLIQASSQSNPLTPTSIQAHLVTTYGGEKIEAIHTELTQTFVQRYGRKLLECFQDVFSNRVSAQNLAHNSKHLMESRISEIRYQQELSPVIWTRMADGTLNGVTYQRKSLFSNQNADMAGWHRHDFGHARTLESIAVGSSNDGQLDALSIITVATDGFRHVEIMENMPQVGDTLADGWFVDGAMVPSYGEIVNGTLTFYGLNPLDGETCDVMVGGIDCSSAAVASGQVSVSINQTYNALLTSAYLRGISSETAYGNRVVPIFDGGMTYYVPAQVGYTYTSQGQLLRPDTLEDTRSPTGPGLGKTRRNHQFAAMLYNTQGISFGVDFGSSLKAAQFKTKREEVYNNTQLFSGVYWGILADDYSYDGMLAWQISRPYPATIMSITGFMQTQD